MAYPLQGKNVRTEKALPGAFVGTIARIKRKRKEEQKTRRSAGLNGLFTNEGCESSTS
jgi:hypothetical protein